MHGFIGVLPMRMSFHGRPVRAALASSLVVDNPAAHPLAGARLLRSYLTGPQELCVSETSNPIAQGMWERIGGRSIAEYSMEWLRPLKPAGLGVALIEEWLPGARILRPPAALADRAIGAPCAGPGVAGPGDARHLSRRRRRTTRRCSTHIPEFAAHYALHPDWDRASLAWFLRHAARKSRHGQLYRRMVYGRNRAPVGCYLYYGRPRQIAWVLQILALPEAVNAVVGDLLEPCASGTAASRCAAARSRICSTRCCATAASSSSAPRPRSIPTMPTCWARSAGDAFIIGLAGEGWTRLIGEKFA